MVFPGARRLLWTALAVPALLIPASGQAVISTRSGVVHYFEGAVSLNDQPLETRLGRFPSMSEGAVLRTAEGRAEVLLTPGVILRIDRNSAIRMLSNSLADSRIELLAGSAMVESSEPAAGTSVTLTYRDWPIRFLEKGVYRIDSTPACVWVREGQAEVTDAATGEPVAVQRGMDLPLAAALVPERSSDEPSDALSNWSRGRADSISADNQIAANIQDPASMTDANLAGYPAGDPALGFAYPSQYGFTQFPMLGLAPVSPLVYGAYGLGQPGFYSLYLPGYTYRPLFLGLLPSAVRSPILTPRTIYSPTRTGVSTITVPRYNPPTAVHPIPAPTYRPAAPPPAIRPVPRAGGRR
jgi:hypothetical protein